MPRNLQAQVTEIGKQMWRGAIGLSQAKSGAWIKNIWFHRAMGGVVLLTYVAGVPILAIYMALQTRWDRGLTVIMIFLGLIWLLLVWWVFKLGRDSPASAKDVDSDPARDQRSSSARARRARTRPD